MGLIKSIKQSVKDTLADQWEEYIKCERLDNDTLVVKMTGANGEISAKSRIQVFDGQVAIICDSGNILDVVAEPGIYEFDDSSSPSIFAGQFGKSLIEVWERFKYNGVRSKEQKVFYINTLQNIDNKFGTSAPMPYDDPEYRSIYIRYFGQYTFRISNPLIFFKSIVGNIDKEYTKAQLMSQANAEFITELDTALSRCAQDGIKFSRLPSEQSRLAQYMNDALDEKWSQNRGMVVESVAIQQITPDDASRERIEKFDNAAMFSKQEYAAGRMVEATASAMEKAAENANGAANGFFGLGVMNMAASNMSGENSPLNYVMGSKTSNAASTPEKDPSGVLEKTCPNCGNKVTGKFCSECGTQLPDEPKSKFCSNCGKPVSGKFCSECGTKCE